MPKVRPNKAAKASRSATLGWGIAALVIGLMIVGSAIRILSGATGKYPDLVSTFGIAAFGFLGVFFCYSGVRMVLNRPRADGTLMPPFAWRILGWASIALPIAMFLFSGLTTSGGDLLRNLMSLLLALAFLGALARVCFSIANQDFLIEEGDEEAGHET